MDYGDVEYEEIDRILNSLKFECIYVKEEQKQKMLWNLFHTLQLITLKNWDVVKRNELCFEDNLLHCIFYINLNLKQYTFCKFFALRKWFINNI